MAEKFIAAAITNNAGTIRVVAVDSKGELWVLWSTESKLFSGLKANVWKNAPASLPAHP